MTLNKTKINNSLISLLTIICVIFPGDIFNLKKILFLLLLVLNCRIILYEIRQKTFVYYFGFVFPIALIVYSLFMGINFATSFSRTFCCFMFLIVPIINKYNINFKSILYSAIYCIIFLMVFFFFIDLIGVVNINGTFPLKTFFVNNDVCIMGKSTQYPLYYKIFFKTSPLIVLPMFEHFRNGKWISSFICVFVLLISGTRANFYISIFLMIIYFIFYYGNDKKNFFVIKVIILTLTLTYIVLNYTDIYNTLYTSIVISGEKSDLVRQGHIRGIIELYNQIPLYYITGMGMGANFYSYGINSFTSSIELPYIDLYRQMGIVFFCMFLWFIIKPINQLYKKKWLVFAYISYLLIAATNPLLFNSTAYIVYVFIYININNKNKKTGDSYV